MRETVTRYVPTCIGKNCMRTLMLGAQGRYTYATAEEAQAWIDSVKSNSFNSPETLRGLFGDPDLWEVRPCECYAGHFDPVSVYFDIRAIPNEEDK